jgi:hypothetical protein
VVFFGRPTAFLGAAFVVVVEALAFFNSGQHGTLLIGDVYLR